LTLFSAIFMNKRCIKIIQILLFTVCIVPLQLYSQDNDNPPIKWNWLTDNWTAQLNLGGSQFYGDVSNKNPLSKLSGETKLAWSIAATKQLSPLFSVRPQLLFSKLYSTKDKFKNQTKYGENASLKFDANIFEFTVSPMINLSRLLWGYETNKPDIYAMVGLGVCSWKSKLKDLKTGYELGFSGASGGLGSKRVTATVLPVGLGITIPIKENWKISLESSWHFVESDRLDVVEGGFVSDMYSITSIGITYQIGTKSPKSLSFSDSDNNSVGIMDYHNDSKPASSKDETYRLNQSESQQTNKNMPQLLDFPATIVQQSIQAQKNNANSLSQTASPENEPSGFIDGSNTKGIVYRVQFLASKVKLIPENILAKYKISEPLSETSSGGWYKYSAGSFKTFAEALNYCKKLKTKGLNGVFVVKYKDGVKVQMKKTPSKLH